MRPRVTTLLLALTGLLVAVAVGLVANAIASRSFTAGVDALPSAGSLAPPLQRTTAVTRKAATGSRSTTAKLAAKPKPAAPKPKPRPATTPKPATTAPAPVAVDDHGGSGKGKGSGTSGSGSSSGHGKHGGDD
jgi:hypothetical protein